MQLSLTICTVASNIALLHNMLPTVFQAVFVSIAGYFVWRLWRHFDAEAAPVRWAIAVGIFLRAAGGAVLFWISYLKLPLARSLQLGDGFWFVGLDGMSYLKAAREGALGGLDGILEISPTVPSVVYVRALGLFCWLFGSAASVGLLLNLFAYVATVLLIVAWARRRDLSPRAAMIPIVAVSFLPSWLVWSVQPMKDTFFSFLIVAFAFAVDTIVWAWSRERGRLYAAGGSALALISIYGLAGVRWYYALAALAIAAVALCVALFERRSPRALLSHAFVSAVLILLSAQLLVAGAGPYLPDEIRQILRPSAADDSADVRNVIGVLQGARENLDAYQDAGTRIRMGGELAEQLEPRTHQDLEQPNHRDANEASAESRSSVVSDRKVAGRSNVAGDVAPTPVRKEAQVRTSEAPLQPIARSVEPIVKTSPSPGVASEEISGFDTTSDVPTTVTGRIITGVIAMFIPPSAAMAAGLVSMTGGRGLWLFADVDTIIFDALLIVVLVSFTQSVRRGGWRDPMIWYLVLTTAALAGALSYAISNYGTLFRHREMVVATLCLLTLAGTRYRRRSPQERPAAVYDDLPAPISEGTSVD